MCFRYLINDIFMNANLYQNKKYYFFHPVFWYAVGYCVWMLIPPFFTEEGHHYPTILADIVGSLVFVFGVILGSAWKNDACRTLNIKINESDVSLLVCAFFLIIYAIRLKLYSEVGVYAFLHSYSREPALLDSIASYLAMPYVVFLISLVYTTRRKVFIVLLLLEIVLFILPVMSRGALVWPFIYLFFAVLYYGRFDFIKATKKFAPAIIVMLAVISIIGPYMQGVRSYVYIGQLEKGLDVVEFTLPESKGGFLVDRLNIHGQSFMFEPVIKQVAELDGVAFKSLAEKLLGISLTYEVNPAEVSNIVGQWIGYGSKTSTDVARNYVLINYEFGLFALVVFNLLFGILLAVIYKIIFVPSSPVFLAMWVPFIFSPAFLTGAMPSTFVFQYIFLIIAFVVLYITYCLLKFVRYSSRFVLIRGKVI